MGTDEAPKTALQVSQRIFLFRVQSAVMANSIFPLGSGHFGKFKSDFLEKFIFLEKKFLTLLSDYGR
jgi:hypothetical protein